MPSPLIRLAPSNELVMIELQGSLEMDDADPKGGQSLAKIEFYPGREDRPTLLISHHRLEGKIVSLTKPLAVLEKKQRCIPENQSVLKEGGTNQNTFDIPSSPARLDQEGKGTLITFNEEQRDIPSSPTPVHLDSHDLDQVTSPTFSRKRALDRIGGEHKNATASNENRAHKIPSSSPIPMKRVQGSEVDYSSPLPASKRRATETDSNKKWIAGKDKNEVDSDLEKDDWLYRKGQTSTYMEVVCIIRKKLLFSKRPEPVVRLDTEGGEEAKVALGLV